MGKELDFEVWAGVEVDNQISKFVHIGDYLDMFI